MKNIYELEKAVNDYMKRHEMELKHSQRNIVKETYKVNTMDYNYLESELITMKSGKKKVKFKVNGKVTSLYK